MKAKLVVGAVVDEVDLIVEGEGSSEGRKRLLTQRRFRLRRLFPGAPYQFQRLISLSLSLSSHDSSFFTLPLVLRSAAPETLSLSLASASLSLSQPLSAAAFALSAKALSLRLSFFSLSDSLSPFISCDCRRRSPQNLCSLGVGGFARVRVSKFHRWLRPDLVGAHNLCICKLLRTSLNSFSTAVNLEANLP
ncbi:hypothetical protein L484_007304 [Morus notabilis]|uniref:Uncharacterized protein n=1 Tax=Morus notabilis TaxID=981085 RepID=W9QLU6_9ROSA|nr:hypothetical protein L484_007304 [Morus notabilis]